MATISTGFISEIINGITVNSSIKCHKVNYNNCASRKVEYIVMHYTGNSKDNAKNNANYFATGSRKASAHFFVDDANIYQSVELRDVAWHCGTSGTYYHKACRNSNAFGIEMCCTAGNYKISKKTLENSAYLCANLCKKLGISADQVDTYVVRHYDVTHKSCPAQMAGSSNAEWKAFKEDVKRILTTGSISKEVATEEQNAVPYLVKITADELNVRKGPSTNYDVVTTVKEGEVFTIVQELNGWGKLKSGAGWIKLSYTKKV